MRKRTCFKLDAKITTKSAAKMYEMEPSMPMNPLLQPATSTYQLRVRVIVESEGGRPPVRPANLISGNEAPAPLHPPAAPPSAAGRQG